MSRSVSVALVFFMLSFISLAAQNLVPNPSFECGEDFCSAFQTPEVKNFSRYACGWSVPGSIGTSDIFSTQVYTPFCYSYMPDSKSSYSPGSQMPHTGNHFAGIFTYSELLSPDTTSYREYLQVKLAQPLKPGQKYCSEMFVSPADNYYFTCNNLGMRFNVNETFVDNFKFLGFTPQVVEKQIISDEANWTKVSGTFVAIEPAQYLIIGNMYGDKSTKSIGVYKNDAVYAAYYFIDDILVEKMPNDYFTFAGATTLCNGDQLKLHAGIGADDVVWTTLSDTMQIVNKGEDFSTLLTETTSFRVRAKGCHKTIVDTVTVTINPLPEVYLGADTTLCRGQHLILSPGASEGMYQWQDQSSDASFAVTMPGIYSVKVTDKNNCSESDFITVDFIDVPEISLGRDSVLCKGPYELIPGSPEYKYEWQDGSTSREYIVSVPGDYWVTATNKCGVTKDTVTIYSASELFIPNIVTPNDDNLNDRLMFCVSAGSETKVYMTLDIPVSLQIFNRWGRPIYLNKNYNGEWPDHLIEGGVYYYKALAQGCPEIKSWVHVMK